MAKSRARGANRYDNSQKRQRRIQKGQMITPGGWPFQGYDVAMPDESLPTPVLKKKAPPLEARTDKQARYINAIKHATVTFGLGPAGSGKTYVAGAVACEMLESKQVERIIITRPAVEAGESLGFLPGELEDKYAPYIAAFRDVLDERLGKSYVEYLLKVGRIVAVPLAYMRGRTFKDCVVVFDEAQNATAQQMKLFLTRLGENCAAIVNGDESQVDIPNSGLVDAVNRIQHIPSVQVVRFDVRDVVRSGFVGEVIEAYETPKAA